jgi:hypothetical protein
MKTVKWGTKTGGGTVKNYENREKRAENRSKTAENRHFWRFGA